MTSDKIDAQGCHLHTPNTRMIDFQRWPTKIASKMVKKDGPPSWTCKSQRVHSSLLGQKTLRRMKSISLHSNMQRSSISFKTKHTEKMKSQKSIFQMCKVYPTFSQPKHLEKGSQKVYTPKKCKSSPWDNVKVKQSLRRIELNQAR